MLTCRLGLNKEFLDRTKMGINEMRISIDRTTQIISYDRTPISVADLKPKRWVYMETEKDPGQNMAKAKKIYLLPRYISPDENHKFPFMK